MSTGVFDYVFLLAFSGVSYEEVAGNPVAPNINNYMAKYASSAGFSGLGYPSEPNVLALSGASTQGIIANTYQQFSGLDIFEDRLAPASLTWKVYAESKPSDPTLSSGNYVFYRNPAIFYSDNYPTNSAQIVAYTQLATDLSVLGNTQNFSWIVPNILDDMSGGPTTIAAGDTWVGTAVSTIMASAAYATGNALIILWWDSDDATANNQVPLVFISPQQVQIGYTSTTPYNHYSLLATIESIFSLNPIGANDAGASTMDEFFAQGPAGVGILTPPVFVADSPPTTIYTGSPFAYQFSAQGSPYPTYAVAAGAVPPGLTLDPIEGNLSGTPTIPGSYQFEISATNSQGVTTTPIVMETVFAASQGINPTPALPLTNFTDPETVTQAVDGSTYYFSVSVTTTGGTSACSPPSVAAELIIPPGPITGLSAVAGNTTAALSWTAPTDTGGVTISGYKIVAFDKTFGTNTPALFSTATTATVAGLVNGHQYTFSVQAANSNNELVGQPVFSQAVIPTGTSNVISAAVPHPPQGAPQPVYPLGIVSYTTFTDYPNAPFDVGLAENVNGLHSEIDAIEFILGVQPFFGLPYQTLGAALIDLAFNKARLNHSHAHSGMSNERNDDHPMYALLSGKRPFTGPVTLPGNATKPTQLITLGQLESYGFQLNELTFGSNPVVGKVPSSEGIAAANYTANVGVGAEYPFEVVGGLWSGVTAPDGLFQIPFSPANAQRAQFSVFTMFFTYTICRFPVNRTGYATYDPHTMDLRIEWVDLDHAMLYTTQQCFISISWIAAGI